MFAKKTRTTESDVRWELDATDAALRDHIFARASALKRKFVRVDFRYSSFDTCYFRDCKFEDCDFTGCRFATSNFHGSEFDGCKFDYAIFSTTQITSSILDTCCPAWENVKSQFARALRTNYQGLGDSDSAAKAMLVELEATEQHLRKAWRSNESYYRKKYKGKLRVEMFLRWGWFRALDLMWGNGEKPGRLLGLAALVLLTIGLVDGALHRDSDSVRAYLAAIADAPAVFLGVTAGAFSNGFLSVVALLRLLLFALFVSALVRRLAKR